MPNQPVVNPNATMQPNPPVVSTNATPQAPQGPQNPPPAPAISSPQVIKKSGVFSLIYLLLIVVGILILVIVSAVVYLGLDSSKAQRFTLFRLIYSHINSNGTIPSPIKLDNPKVLKFGTTYLLEGTITQIKPRDNGEQGVIIKTDIEDLPELTIDPQITQILSGWNTVTIKASVQDIKLNQSIKIVPAYSPVDNIWNVHRIYLED